ncbi:MAG: transposase, partial [Acidimicrobiales bacterium]
MAFHYAGENRDQLFLLAVSMRDWLDEGHLAWFVIDVVARIDTSALHARHPNDGPGRPAYNPDTMLAVLFYAYGMGVRSSRRIEALCRTDAAFRVLAAGATPDHATIARFFVDHERAVEDAFVEVLRLCAAAGLASVGTIAVDGTKMGTDAALDANRGRGAIVAERQRLHAEVEAMLAEGRSVDAAEDAQQALFGL